jgi:DNA-binding transcriptional LysR family regulator
METRHLRYFLAVVDHGSVSRAADWLGIAQPALSQSVGRMEKELGVRLFDRSRQGAAPTAAAKAILEDVRVSVARIDAAARRARDIAAGSAGQFKVGIVTSALVEILPRAMRAMRKVAPGVQVVLREMSTSEQAEALSKGEIDLGLMHTPVAIAGRMCERLILRDRLVAAVPDEFTVGPDGGVTLAQIAQAGLVLYPEYQLPVFYAGILDVMRKAGLAPLVTQEANRTFAVLSCVAGGCGVGLVPGWIQAINFRGVRFCKVVDGEGLPRMDLSAIWPARSVPTLADVFGNLDLGPIDMPCN